MASIGNTARELINANPNLSNKDLLALVMAQHPDANTTVACIAWYKSDMKKKGIIGMQATERTEALIRADLEAAEAKVEMLKEELKAKLESSKVEKAARLEALKKELAELEAAASQE